MATAAEQKVYVSLPWDFDKGKHILSWTLSHFPKDKTRIVATIIISPLSTKYSDALPNQWRERSNETLDKHVAQCAIQKFKAETLTHKNDDVVEGILELIDLMAIKNLVMGFSPNSEVAELVKEKANPSCMIWFIRTGNLLLTRYPRLDLTEAASEKNNVEMVLQRREKLHLKEIEEILKRANDKNDLLEKEKEQLKLEILLLRNQRNYDELKKQQLENSISDLEVTYNKLKQERNAIKGALELRKQKDHSFANSDMVTSCHFSLSELEQATQNFSDSLKIGEGNGSKKVKDATALWFIDTVDAIPLQFLGPDEALPEILRSRD